LDYLTLARAGKLQKRESSLAFSLPAAFQLVLRDLAQLLGFQGLTSVAGGRKLLDSGYHVGMEFVLGSDLKHTVSTQVAEENVRCPSLDEPLD
jgi:hypothetical protein